MFSNRFQPLAAAMVIAVAALGVPSAQASLLVDLSPGGFASACGGCGYTGTTWGWQFSVNTSVEIAALAAWDADSDGLGYATEVGLFTSTGDLLAQVSIDDASDRAASSSGEGNWAVGWIPTLTLTPGDYLIGQVFFNDTPLAQLSASPLVDDRITLTGGVFSMQADTGLAAPMDAYVEPIFGPSLLAVPEPGSLLTAGAALGALVVSRRRRHV